LVLAEARGRLVASDEKRRFHRQANSETYTLLFDGVFFEGKGDEGTLAFWPLPAPPDDEVGLVLARIAARVQRLLERRGLDPGRAEVFEADPAVEESPALAGIGSASIQGRIAPGLRAGARVWSEANIHGPAAGPSGRGPVTAT
jgi:hypothetical protein